MPQPKAIRQRQLFEEPTTVSAVRFPLNVQDQLRQALVQWMRELAKTSRKEECDDEQDHR
jgi:hypothetical protein